MASSRTLVGLGGDGGVGGGGSGSPVLLHSPTIIDPAEHILPVPGEIVSITQPTLSTLQAISDGILTIDGVSTGEIDLTAATNLGHVTIAITTAIGLISSLAGYGITVILVGGSSFHTKLYNLNGDILAVTGSLAAPLELNSGSNPTISSYIMPSDFITLPDPPSGKIWDNMFFGMFGDSYANTNWRADGVFFDDGINRISRHSSISNTSAWYIDHSDASPFPIGIVMAWNLHIATINYDPDTRIVSWVPQATQLRTGSFDPSINSLFIVGTPRSI